MTQEPDKDAVSRAWVNGLKDAARVFSKDRGISAPAVRITLTNGDWFYVYGAATGIPNFIGFTIYPEDDADMVRNTDGRPVPSRSVYVPISSIYKVELDVQAPREERVGFFVEDALAP
jgi:hypothetical protein